MKNKKDNKRMLSEVVESTTIKERGTVQRNIKLSSGNIFINEKI